MEPIPFNVPGYSNRIPALPKGPDGLRTLGTYYQQARQMIMSTLQAPEVILTHSCTAALELVALALDIRPGDEVILPSYTYVSTANAFALRGATLVFADVRPDHPSLDWDDVERRITPKTKAVVVVHYAGMLADVARMKALKRKYGIVLVEDAAHAYGSQCDGYIAGTIGDFATFSFHETKNITCGQGGALVIHKKRYIAAANTAAYCGTNKLGFIRHKVSHYSWQALGSNYLLAEPLCAILFHQLQLSSKVNAKRLKDSLAYYSSLIHLEQQGFCKIMPVPTGNGHIFYLTVSTKKLRNQLIDFMQQKGIQCTFHYTALHSSPFFLKQHAPVSLTNTKYFDDGLVRLPMFYSLSEVQRSYVTNTLIQFFQP